MSLVGDIGAAYLGPRRALRAQLARGIREEQLLFYVMLFCLLSYIALLPDLSYQLRLQGADASPFVARAGAQFVASVFMAPLLLYGLAALSHLVLARFGGKARWIEARLALFWAALVTVPLVLATGAAKVVAPANLAALVSAITGLVFLWQWFSCLWEVEFSAHHSPARQN
jgi:hypothetical protein